MNDSKAIWKRLVESECDRTLSMSMWRVAQKLSYTTCQVFAVRSLSIEKETLEHLVKHLGSPETEIVGIYLRFEDGLRGRALLILTMENALSIAQRMIGEGKNITFDDPLVRSALAEVGNVLVASFLNTVAENIEDPSGLMRPTPPAVTVDMLGAILSTVVAPLLIMDNELLIIKAGLKTAKESIQAEFWLMPESEAQNLIPFHHSTMSSRRL